jgi:hypothetical protein
MINYCVDCSHFDFSKAERGCMLEHVISWEDPTTRQQAETYQFGYYRKDCQEFAQLITLVDLDLTQPVVKPYSDHTQITVNSELHRIPCSSCGHHKDHPFHNTGERTHTYSPAHYLPQPSSCSHEVRDR